MYKEDLKPIILNEVKGEIKHQFLSVAKVKEILVWSPKHLLEEGLKDTIEWYKGFFKDMNMKGGSHD